MIYHDSLTTDYFTRLGPQMQAEVMLRTEYQAV